MKCKKSIIRYLLSAGIITILFTGCTNKTNEARLKNELDSLHILTIARDSMVNEFLASFNDIENGLDSITQKQKIIMDKTKSRGDIKSSARERINQDIAMINELMDKNRRKIESLNKNLRRVASKYLELEKTFNVVRDQLSRKDNELVEMNRRLSKMSDSIIVLKTSVDTLTFVEQSQAKVISDQTNELHTAYYIVGDKKELVDKKIIDSEGGVLGLGKTHKIVENVESKNFNKIDYTLTTLIPVNSKRAKLLTSHPDDSYSMDKDENGEIIALRIILPEKFWSVSKYMVIVKQG